MRRIARFLRPLTRRVLSAATAAAGLALLPSSLAAQRFFSREPEIDNLPYDGRFTFARIKYETGPGGYYYMGLPAWAHGYPRAENNLMKILDLMSYLHPHLGWQQCRGAQ